MAFTFSSPSLAGHISESEAILFNMLRLLGADFPQLARLEKEFYESPPVMRKHVAELRREALVALRGFHASGRTIFDQAMAQQTPAFLEMASDLEPSDPERCLASLIAVCDDALEQNSGIECRSD